MAQILVRDLSDEVVAELKRRARQHGRSLQAEVRALLERTADEDRQRRDFVERALRWQEHWRAQGKTFSDSAELLRELRDER